jgi:hypothetical protein
MTTMPVKQLIKRVCPPVVIGYYRWLQSVAREGRLRDTKCALFGEDADLVPPLRLMHDGPADYQEFAQNGKEFLRHYIELS